MAIAKYSFTDWSEGPATSFSHSVDAGTGSNRYLVVGVRNNGVPIDDVNAPTYNGVTMTLLYKRQNTNAQTLEYQYWFGLIAPATGSNTLTVTTTASISIQWFAAAFSGVKQSGQPDATASNATGSSNSAFTGTIVTVANGCYIMMMADDNNGNMAAGTLTIKVSTWSAGLGQQTFERSSNPVGAAGSYVLTLSGSNGNASDVTLISLSPAPDVVIPPQANARQAVKRASLY